MRKFLQYTSLSLLFLFLVAAIGIQLPFVQQWAKNTAFSYLEKQTGGSIKAEDFGFTIFGDIWLDDLIITNLENQKFLSMEALEVDLAVCALLYRNINLEEVTIRGLDGALIQFSDSSWNYDFLTRGLKSGTDVSKEKGSSWNFNPGAVEIFSSRFLYKTNTTGDSINLSVGHFHSDLTGSRIPASFSLKNTSIDSLSIQLAIHPSQSSGEGGKLPALNLGNINILHARIQYTDGSSILLEGNIPKGSLVVDELDLHKPAYIFNNLNLEKPEFSLSLWSIDTTASREVPFYLPGQTLGLSNTRITDGFFSYQSFQNDSLESGFEGKGINTSLESLKLSKDSATIELSEFSCLLNKEAHPISLTAKCRFNKEKSEIEQFEAILEAGAFSVNGTAPPIFGAYLNERFGKGKNGNLTLKGRNIIPERILQIINQTDLLPVTAQSIAKRKVSFQTDLHLSNNQVSLPSMLVDWNKTLHLSGSASTSNPWNKDNLKFTLDIRNSYLDVMAIQFINSLTDSLTDLKENIVFAAALSGTSGEVKGQASLSTERNKLTLAGKYNMDNQSYDLHGDISAGNYVHLIKREGLPSHIGGEIELEGKGLDPDTMYAKFAVNLREFNWKEYSYQKIDASGTIDNGIIDAKVLIDDPNLQFDLTSQIDISDTLSNINLKGQLFTANLHTLGLSEKIYDLRAGINADIAGNDPAKLNGFILLDNFLVQTIDTIYRSDSIRLVSKYQDGFSDISLYADFMGFMYAGDIPVFSLPDYGQMILGRHLPLDQTKVDSLDRNRSGKITLKIDNLGEIASLVMPGLTKIEGLDGSFQLMTSDSSLSGNIKAKEINYQGLRIFQTQMENKIDKDSFESVLQFDSIIGGGLQIPFTRLSGHLMRDTVYLKLQVKENDSTDLVKFVGNLFKTKDQFRLSLAPGQQIINKEKWRVNKGNYIEISKGLDYTGTLKLYNDNKFFQVLGNGKADSVSHYKISFKNLELAGFTNLMSEDFGEMDGNLGGNLVARGVFKNPRLFGNFTIDQFSYKKEIYGNLSFSLQKDTKNLYRASIKGNGEWIDINGNVSYQAANDSLQGQIKIAKLGISPLEPVLNTYADSIAGHVHGQVSIAGTLSNPNLTGNLELEKLEASIKATNTRYFLPKGAIDFKDENINIQSLAFRDKEGNQGILKGKLTLKSMDDISYDLDFQSNQFLFLNTRKVENLNYYGEVQSSAKLEIKGDTRQTVVDGVIHIDEGTSFKMSLPDVTRYDRKEGLVKFVDRDAPMVEEIAGGNSNSRQVGLENHQLEINTRIEIDEKASLTIIMDPQSGDKLQVAGSGNLVLRMEKSGYMSLNGNYQVSRGTYNFSFYKLLRRDFLIQSGSSLTWTGDPLNPEADITGIYQVEASPEPLLSDLQSNTSRLPFEVTMQIEGPIQGPDIDYQLRLPSHVSSPHKSTINSRLSLINRQQNEKSKQVFGLLVLSSFLTPDNQTADNSFAGTAYRSLSEMLTSQLNQLSKKYIKGIDVNLGVDLNDQNSALPEAQVSLNLQKELFDDNVIVSVGGNYQNREDPAASNITTDIKVTYKLTEDGRFQLSVFRKGEYEGDVEGDVIKTGITLVFMKNFDTFKEIFEKSKNQERTPW